MTKIPSIPTMFNGTQFRSRLEAKWAAFFDNLNWRWEYEPLDLDGWIPDFVLWPGGKLPLLADVKPSLVWSDFEIRCEEIRALTPKTVLLLGATVPVDDAPEGYSAPGEPIGALRGLIPWAGTTTCIACVTRCPKGHVTIWEGNGDYTSNACGCRDDEAGHKWFASQHDPTNIVPEVAWAWREAGNLVQWVGKDSKVRSSSGSAPDFVRP